MTLAAVPGSFVSAGAVRRTPVPAAGNLLGAVGALIGVRSVVVVVVLPVVGLLLALVLITAGCGPPN